MFRVRLPIQLSHPAFQEERRLLSGRIEAFDCQDLLVLMEDVSSDVFGQAQELDIFCQPQRNFVKQRVGLLDIEPFDSTDELIAIGQTAKRLGMHTSIDLHVQAAPKTCLRIRIRPVGEVMSAETRRAYRVSCAGGRRMVTLEGTHHRLLDASATGAAVESINDFLPGDHVAVAFELNGKQYAGPMTIQNCRALHGGHFRYGLMPAPDQNKIIPLSRGLQALTMQIQREQAQRRSGRDAFSPPTHRRSAG